MASNDSRPLLSHTSQGPDITFVPVTMSHNEPRQYVFVDEHNRHRRLKVMRACEGCRRRKIRCEGANTNTWPCAACVRLRVTCVPPAMNFDNTGNADANGDSDSSDTGPNPVSNDERFNQGYTSDPNLDLAPTSVDNLSHGLYTDQSTHHMNPPFQFSPSLSQHGYDSAYASRGSTVGFQSHSTESNYRPPLRASFGSESGFRSETPAEELSEALGDLRITVDSIAPYITNQSRSLADAPAMEDFEVPLPAFSGSDMMVRIPPEMMPSEQQAMQYFEYFFTNIHPYVPVLNRTYFFQQWHSNRQTISPLILEAIFACSSRMMNNDTEANQWLALISKHEESFKDVPRLSTIQAMLLVLKAREAIPKRGYYYRSWMTIVGLIATAKDLGLDEHYEDHQIGKACNSTLYECAAKSRVWHTLFVIELIVGGPQGRTDFSVHLDTVDFDIPKSIPGLDEAELRISQQYTFLLRIIKNVRGSSQRYAKLSRRNEVWALDPEFVAHNVVFEPWLQSLPPHLKVTYPEDGSPPYIPFHFVANIHSYYELAVIMHHRPQLQAAAEMMDGSSTELLVVCYSAAKKLCRLQEAILQHFGLPGLLCMLRGINFTIYSILTCTMVHLVALTSPDSTMNLDAKEFFPRHMRILEQCSDSWPMREIRQQIDSLREAFSADMNKPFELKASFPFNSPRAMTQHSPSSDVSYNLSGVNHGNSSEQTQPPLFRAVSGDATMPSADPILKLDDSSVHSYSPMHSQHVQTPDSQAQWNPSRLLDQWNTAFFPSPSAVVSPQYSYPPPIIQDGRAPSSNPFGNFGSTTNSVSPPPTTNQAFFPPVQVSTASMPVANYVTPSMWQEAVAGTYGGSLKRRWDEPAAFGLKRAK